MTIHDPRHSDVIIIGGGATGAGIARDCALRGLSVTLLNNGADSLIERLETERCRFE